MPEAIKEFEGKKYIWNETSKKYLPETREFEGKIFKLNGDKYLPEQKKEDFGNMGRFGGMPNDPIDARAEFKDKVAPLIEGTAVNLGRVGGAALGSTNQGGALLGGAAGGVAADMAYKNTLQRIAPEWFGAPEGNLVDQLKSSASNTVLDYVGGKVAEGVGYVGGKIGSGISSGVDAVKKGEIKERLLNYFFPTPDKVDKSAIEELIKKGDNVTLGQITQNPKAQALENTIAPDKKQNIITGQQRNLKGELETLGHEASGSNIGPRFSSENPLTSHVNANTATEKAAASFKAEEGKRKQLWGDFNKHKGKAETVVIQKNPNYKPEGTPSSILGPDGKPTMVPSSEPEFIAQKVKDPVILTNTAKFSNEVLSQIEKDMNDPTFVKIPGDSSGLMKLRDTLEAIRSIPKDPMGQPVQNYGASQQLEKDIDSAFEGTSEELKKRYVKTLNGIRNFIAKDQEESIAKYWPKGASEDYAKASEQTKKVAETFGKAIGQDLVAGAKDPNIVKQNVLNAGLQNVQNAKQFIAATGDRNELGSELAYQLIRDNWNPHEQAFNVRGLLEKFKDKEDVARIALPSKVREGFEFALKRLSMLDPRIPSAVSLGQEKAAMGATGDALASAATGTIRIGWGTKAMAVFPFTKPVVEKLFLDPVTARKVARLAMLSPQSSEAGALSKSIQHTLRGLQMEKQYATQEQKDDTQKDLPHN